MNDHLSKKQKTEKKEISREKLIWEQKFEWVTLANYTTGIDERAALVYFATSFKDIEENLDESQHLYPAVNVVFFHLDSKQA